MSNDILRSANTTLDQRFVKSVTLLRGRVEIRWPRELIIICEYGAGLLKIIHWEYTKKKLNICVIS